jgi:hypothetical protein
MVAALSSLAKMVLTLALSFYRSMASTPLPLTVGTNWRIVMVGGQLIRRNKAANSLSDRERAPVE